MMREKLKKLKELKQNSKNFVDLLTSCYFKRTIDVALYPGGLLTPSSVRRPGYEAMLDAHVSTAVL